MARRAVATLAIAIAAVNLPAVRNAAARQAVFALSGSVTITDADRGAVLPSTGACRSQDGALTAGKRIVLRPSDAHLPTAVAKLVESPESALSFGRGPCRLSFRIRDIARSSSYSLTIADRRVGTWTGAALQRSRWTLYFDAQRGSKPRQWRLVEVPQIHHGQIPVPNVSLPGGLQFDPIAWRKEWTTTPGTQERRCAPVGHHTDVRSGSFIVGNFDSYIQFWDGTLTSSKLYYVPLYPQGTPPLAVTARPLDSPGPALSVLREHNDAWGATGDFFYATGTVLPHRGRWRLVATAGRNRGCFDLTL